MIYAADYRKVGAWLICAVELQERNGRGAKQIMWTRRKPSAGLVVPPAASFPTTWPGGPSLVFNPK